MLSTGLKFRLEEVQLIFIELRSLRVGEQAIQAPGDMPQMESNGRYPSGVVVKLGIRKGKAPFPEVFFGEL